ncbi:hypothetical protein [Curtobacterium sp. MCSS17_007]|uniref:hypothetical protein n=1 Tax=Curtobacterium sp. MCSS17_007 TaxID=2175646 RepID=UPI000DA920CC|nr:hypothetical protein [Curtobacterium sp. MCSS17_007]WIE74500.1 hypothetical protein DEJ22_009415 [Curtobacterium sp. MCSS17_007]
MNQLGWLIEWGRIGHGLSGTFQDQLTGRRPTVDRNIVAVLFPAYPSKSHVRFRSYDAAEWQACYDGRMIRSAIRLGYAVEISQEPDDTIPEESHQSH